MMKKIFLFSLLIAFILTSAVSYAQEKALIGNGNIALKMDYLNFTESALEDLDNDDCFYVGLEAYNKVSSNFYIGMEVGYTNSEGDARIRNVDREIVKADTELTYVPIELNLKYALDITPKLAVDFGAGPSYNWMKEELSGPGLTTAEDWLWGGQLFADLDYKIDRFFLGINVKYQFTENFEIDDHETDVNANNWRVGGQVGIMF